MEAKVKGGKEGRKGGCVRSGKVQRKSTDQHTARLIRIERDEREVRTDSEVNPVRLEGGMGKGEEATVSIFLFRGGLNFLLLRLLFELQRRFVED